MLNLEVDPFFSRSGSFLLLRLLDPTKHRRRDGSVRNGRAVTILAEAEDLRYEMIVLWGR
jgi:hypothetical protein